jgi:hypothetical protein
MEKQNGTSFHLVLNPAFILSFCARKHSAFKKTGIYPSVAMQYSEFLQLSSCSVPKTVQQNSEVNHFRTGKHTSIAFGHSETKKENRCSVANCLTTPYGSTAPAPEPSATTSKEPTLANKPKRTKGKRDEDRVCGVCDVTYSEDARKKIGVKWVQCSLCLILYRVLCQQTDA